MLEESNNAWTEVLSLDILILVSILYMKSILTPLSIAVSVTLVVGAFIITREGEEDEESLPSVAEIRADIVDRDWSGADRNAVGDPDAPVTIVEYSDYACPFCTRYWETTLPQIKETFIDEGIVRYIYRDFAVVGGHWAAEAAWCADEQGAFWDYHDLLFSRHTEDRQRWNNVEIHRIYANALELDAEELASCFEERRFEERVSEMTQEATEQGGRGTPFFLVNDRGLSGAHPFETFEEVIHDELDTR